MRKIKKENTQTFIIVNQQAEVFFGLVGGYPKFTNDWCRAKPLNNIRQFENVQRGTLDKLELMWL